MHPLRLSAAGNELYAINTVESRLAIFASPATARSVSPATCRSASTRSAWRSARAPTRCGSSTICPIRSASSTRRRVRSSTRSRSATSRPMSCSPAGAPSSASAAIRIACKVYNASTRALVATLDIFGDDPRALAVNAARHRGLRGGARVGQPVDDAVPGSRRRRRRSAAAESAAQRLARRRAGRRAGRAVQPGDRQLGGRSRRRLEQLHRLQSRRQRRVRHRRRRRHAVGDPPAHARRHHRSSTSPCSPAPATSGSPTPTHATWCASSPSCAAIWSQTRITVVDPVSGVVPPFIDLNSHINYNLTPGPPAEVAASLAHPGAPASSTAAARPTTSPASARRRSAWSTTATGNVDDLIDVGDGPSGLALNEADGRLYVLNRFDNTISTVDTAHQHRARPYRRRRAVELRSQPRRHQGRPQVPLRRPAHLGPRRRRLRDLPPLRQLRQPRLGARRSAGRLRRLRPSAVGEVRSARPVDQRLRSAEGADDHADAARPAGHGAVPLARRPAELPGIQSRLHRADGHG